MRLSEYDVVSPFGVIRLTASDQGLRRVDLRKSSSRNIKRPEAASSADKIVLKAAAQLEEYFAGRRQVFDLPLDVEGTPFQKKVWKELSRIPFGRTVSYRDVARAINNPRAVRAVGGANGKNPICIIIPCHRVIAADGSIGGYSGGLPVKRRLLQIESGLKT